MFEKHTDGCHQNFQDRCRIHITSSLRVVGRLWASWRSVATATSVQDPGLSCYGHHRYGGLMCLLLDERALASADCLLVWRQRLSQSTSQTQFAKQILTKDIQGWLACVVGGSCLLGQICGGILCRYIKKSRYILIGGTLSLLVFSASMVTINPGQQSKGVGLMFMACFSVGIVETCSLALAPLALPSEDIGAALGALGSIRSGGASVATVRLTCDLYSRSGSVLNINRYRLFMLLFWTTSSPLLFPNTLPQLLSMLGCQRHRCPRYLLASPLVI